MAIDLQKLLIYRLLKNQDNDLYSKLMPYYFTGTDYILFNKVQSFYKANLRLPSIDEFIIAHKGREITDYLENNILVDENNDVTIEDQFLVSQLQDFFVREKTISFLDEFIDNLENLEKIEILEEFQDHILKLNQAIPHNEELFDVGDLNFFPNEDDFDLYPSGLSAEYDATNGGFGTEELVLLGGRRGSGKSIIALNLAFNRYKQGSTVAMFSIEMRYKEVYDRLLSIVSGVPFLDIFKNQLTAQQKIKLAEEKFNTFYKPSKTIDELIKELKAKQNFKEFESRVKNENLELTDNRFFIIDDESLTLNRIDHYCNMLGSKYPKFNLGVVDYLNIIKHPDQKNWQSQIEIADNLKSLARKHSITILSPYQIDASGEARFAKGILDSADRSFNFFPPPEEENRELNSKITIHTTKIRNGKHMSFDVHMDWPCVKIDPNQSQSVSEKPHNAVKYGSDKSEDSRDI